MDNLFIPVYTKSFRNFESLGVFNALKIDLIFHILSN
jgi:hypothetical protein